MGSKFEVTIIEIDKTIKIVCHVLCLEATVQFHPLEFKCILSAVDITSSPASFALSEGVTISINSIPLSSSSLPVG